MATTDNPDNRIAHPGLRQKIVSAETAAAMVQPGWNVGMSGFTGAGYPKAVPLALARRIGAAHAAGQDFRIGLWTGSSMAPDLDSALAQVEGIDMHMPYQSDPTTRAKINAGAMQYVDIHLSDAAQFAWFGFLGHLNVAVIEVAGILEDGRLICSTSVGNNKAWLEQAERVILEVNTWQNPALDGMHDIYYGTTVPPFHKPIPIYSPSDRVGGPYLRCDPQKVIAVVQTNAPDHNNRFAVPDRNSKAIAGHIIDFLQQEVKASRLPKELLPLQSGIGNMTNAVLTELNAGPFENLTAYTEELQDGMLEMIKSGKMRFASATALSLSPEMAEYFNTHIDEFKDRIVLRPQEISNNPGIIRRLGVIAMNTAIEMDIYGNVNNTHLTGSSIVNGIGGSGDFARNAFLSIFMTPSVSKNGAISHIVPMVSHVDHTEHDTKVIVTEQGLADLRGLSPQQRAYRIIDRCAHPDYRQLLYDYLERARAGASGKHTPHLLGEALSWHQRLLETGSMQPFSGLSVSVFPATHI